MENEEGEGEKRKGTVCPNFNC